jgi:integrase
MSQNELLKFAAENGMLNLTYVQDVGNMQKTEKILSDHPYEVWQGKDGRWRTYLSDETNKYGRKLIAKATLDKINEMIIADYEEKEKLIAKSTKERITLDDLKQEWFDYKNLSSASYSYVVRLEYDYDKYWKGSKIVNMPIQKITKLDIKTYLLNKVRNDNLTKRKYSDMKSVINMMFDYAELKEIISGNIARQVVIDKKLFTKKIPKPDDEQVYSTEEEVLITKAVLDDYCCNQDMTPILAIPLGFKIGDRIGEVAALKGSDIIDNYIHIQRQEIAVFEKDESTGKWRKNGWKDVEFTKTEAGDRYINLVPEAKKIVDMLIESNIRNGYDPQGYLFMKDGQRVHTRTIDKYIRMYNKKLGIKQKSNHKIRKTFGSSLVDSSMNIDKATKTMGQVDSRTLLNNYCFNRFTEPETERQMREALARGAKK